METVQAPGDLEAIQVFVQVVQSGSFTLAARALGLPKSTVSRRVTELESRLGMRLLQRTTRKVAPTDVGAAYAARAARALGELREAEEALAAAQAAPTGVLRMSAPVDIAQDLLPGLVGEYCRRYPDVAVQLHVDNRRVDLIAEGFDLALRATVRLEDSSLVARKLITAATALFATRQYLAARGTPQAPEDLHGHDLLLFRGEVPRSRLRLERGDEHVEVDVQGRIAATDFGFLRSAALADLGIAPLPTFNCASDLANGQLVRVLPGWHLGTASLHAVYPSSRHLSPKVRAFVELATEQLGKLVGPAEHGASL